MLVADLKLHSLVDTPHGKGTVIAASTQLVGPGQYAWTVVTVKVFYEPNKIYPRGIERNIAIADVDPWIEPAAPSPSV